MHRTLIILLLFISSLALAQPPGYKAMKDTAAFRQKMEKASKAIMTIESDFVQEKYMSVMSEKLITKGHFQFKKVNMLRWEYTEPKKYLVTINKDKMLIRDNGKVSRFDIAANRIFKGVNDMMMATVQGNLLSSRDYHVTYFESDKYFLLELKPVARNMKKFLASIHLYLNKTDYSVEKVRMTEPGDDYTLIDFLNRKTNQPIPDERFTITQ